MNDVDRVAEINNVTLRKRLVAGASILLKLWRQGIRCGGGWSMNCSCHERVDFCAAKEKWIGLLKELHGDLPYNVRGTDAVGAIMGRSLLTGAEPFFIVEAMTPKMIQASGLTVLVETPGARKPLKMGGSPENWNVFYELAQMDPDSVPIFLDTYITVQEKF